MSSWRFMSVALTCVFFLLSVRWSYLDRSPPAWDQGLYLYQAAKLHFSLVDGGAREFLISVFNVDRGRVPLMLLLVQPAFYVFGPLLDVAVVSLNFCWFLLAWALLGILKELVNDADHGRAAFFTLLLFGLYPLTVMLTHNFLVELLLASLVCAAVYSILVLRRLQTIKWSLLAGFFVGLGLLTKVTFIVFVLPLLALSAWDIRKNASAKQLGMLFFPGCLVVCFVALPYYIYNFREILSLTSFLSSKGLAELYGFGAVFDLSTIFDYWRSIFWAPSFLVAFVLIVFSMRRGFFSVLDRFFILTLFVWFFIPFVLATFGQIKDPRYLFPALLPVFLFSGVVAARSDARILRWGSVGLVVVLMLPGYLFSNGYLSKTFLSGFSKVPGLSLSAVADSPPDPRDWMMDRVIGAMAGATSELSGDKKIIFLGGNRYYHLRLMDYLGLMSRVDFNYLTLPYYSEANMTLDRALEFVGKSDAIGLIFKSGENWPKFSSRLDLEIVEALKRGGKFFVRDLGIEQPDGSRFLFLQSKSFAPVAIASPSAVFGEWRVGGGVSKMSAGIGQSILIVTEVGSEGVAVLRDGEIYIQAWGVSGKMTADASSIRWSNGSVWHRSLVQ